MVVRNDNDFRFDHVFEITEIIGFRRKFCSLTTKRGNGNTQDAVIIFKSESVASDFASEESFISLSYVDYAILRYRE